MRKIEDVKVGEYVSFKSDVEQCGKISKISGAGQNKSFTLVKGDEGFEGDYIGGDNVTVQMASDCWVE